MVVTRAGIDSQPAPSARFTYAAFISYSHRPPDERWAIWLHRAIESYRIPKVMVKAGFRRRVGRVFRDDEELATNSNLTEAIEQALEDSARLIVICSPRAARSKWIDAEVRHFQKIGRGNAIQTLLIEGTPRGIVPAVSAWRIRRRRTDGGGRPPIIPADVVAAPAAADEAPGPADRLQVRRSAAART